VISSLWSISKDYNYYIIQINIVINYEGIKFFINGTLKMDKTIILLQTLPMQSDERETNK